MKKIVEISVIFGVQNEDLKKMVTRKINVHDYSGVPGVLTNIFWLFSWRAQLKKNEDFGDNKREYQCVASFWEPMGDLGSKTSISKVLFWCPLSIHSFYGGLELKKWGFERGVKLQDTFWKSLRDAKFCSVWVSTKTAL